MEVNVRTYGYRNVHLICLFCPIISDHEFHNNIINLFRFGAAGRSSDPRQSLSPQELVIATSIPQRGGGAFLNRHTLFSFHTCALGLIRKSYLGVPYPRPLSQISVAIYSCIVHSYSCIVHSFMTALGRNGQSYTLSPQFVLVCKFNVHDAQTKGTFAQFDSPGQSLVEAASPRHDYYKFRPKYISEFVELYFLAEVTS